MNAYEKLNSLNERCKLIFDIIQKHGPITKNELIDRTKMKLTTLNRDIQLLLDRTLILEKAIGESTGGRKPVLFDINPYGLYSVGVDISRMYIQIVIIDLKAKIIGEKIIYDLTNYKDTITKTISELCDNLKINKDMLIGIGIGIYEGIQIDELQIALNKQFEIPIYVENGSNAAVIGEYFFGLGKDKENLAYINCGVGIRTGVISKGVLIRTINNSEDALAHMIVDTDGEPCFCGNLGCVEAYASIEKIRDKFIASIENVDLNKVDYNYIIKLSESGNETAINILLTAAKHFGIGLANYIRLLNPQLIILSGPLVKDSKLFFEESIKVAMDKCGIKNNNVVFERGGYFFNKSIAVGAAVIVFESSLTNYKSIS